MSGDGDQVGIDNIIKVIQLILQPILRPIVLGLCGTFINLYISGFNIMPIPLR